MAVMSVLGSPFLNRRVHVAPSCSEKGEQGSDMA